MTKVIGIPHIDHDPDFLKCLYSKLEEGETVHVCNISGTHFLNHYHYKNDKCCIFCSGSRTSIGTNAQQRNRDYGKEYQRRKYKRRNGNGRNEF